MDIHFREPIAGILVVQDPREALDVRKMALSSGILLTCVAGPELAGGVSGLPQLSGNPTSVSRDRRGLGVAVVVCNERSSCAVKETNAVFPSTPVLAIVGEYETPEGRAAILRAGAIDVLAKPFTAVEFTRRVTNVAQSYGYRAFADRELLDYEDEVRNAIGEILLREYEALYVLGKASEYKDQETGAMIALTHHERIDGAGYPMGLRGDDIPLYGRIVCVADVFDALTTRRPYKSAWTIDDALEHLRSQRGTQFDPDMVDAFVYNEPGVRQIFGEHSEEAYPNNPRVSW